jgi:hypothetical protein
LSRVDEVSQWRYSWMNDTTQFLMQRAIAWF